MLVVRTARSMDFVVRVGVESQLWPLIGSDLQQTSVSLKLKFLTLSLNKAVVGNEVSSLYIMIGE